MDQFMQNFIEHICLIYLNCILPQEVHKSFFLYRHRLILDGIMKHPTIASRFLPLTVGISNVQFILSNLLKSRSTLMLFPFIQLFYMSVNCLFPVAVSDTISFQTLSKCLHLQQRETHIYGQICEKHGWSENVGNETNWKIYIFQEFVKFIGHLRPYSSERLLLLKSLLFWVRLF